MSLDELKAEAMKLGPESRAELAHALLLSLNDMYESEIEKLWLEEAIRRDKEDRSRQGGVAECGWLGGIRPTRYSAKREGGWYTCAIPARAEHGA